METNQIFNWKRFMATLRMELAENGRILLLIVVGIYLFFFIELTVTNLRGRGMYDNVHDPFFFLMFIALITSLGFSKLTTKGKRTDYFSMPSSTLEKYLVNTLVYVIGGLVAVHLCSYLADATRIAVLWPRQSDSFLVPGLSAIPNTAIKWIEPGGTLSLCIPLWVAHCLFLVSMYLIGSIVCPRYSFLKTTVVYILIIIILRIGAGLISGLSSGHLGIGDENMAWKTLHNAFPIAILCWVIGGYLFKRKDVISTKRWK